MEETNFFRRSHQVSAVGGLRIACYVKEGVGVLTKTRTLPHYTLVYVTNGRGEYWDENGVSCPVDAGDSILVCPGVEHWYGPPQGSTWNETYVVFEGAVFDLWRHRRVFDAERPVKRLAPISYWKSRIKEAVGAHHDNDEYKMLLEAARLQMLLAEIEEASSRSNDADLKWLERAQSALEETIDPKTAAARMNMGYEAFRKKFKRLDGVSPGKYCQRRVMDEACAMLANSKRSIKSIAEELGFCDEYHFSKQFHKTVGWSPKEYRTRVCRS